MDEAGYLPLEPATTQTGSFRSSTAATPVGSTIVTSNKAIGEWARAFGDEVLAAAILDRLLHDAEVLTINGPSYRLKGRLEALEGSGEGEKGDGE